MDTNFTLSTPGGRRSAWLDALFADHAVFRLIWDNWAVVRPGVLYRCNHPTPGRLAAMTRRHGLKTLISLRGAQARNGSDVLTREAAARLGLNLIDMPLRGRRAPARSDIEKLAEVYRTMQVPALIHCKSGADRTGLAAGVFILLDGGSVQEASRHLSLRFGHLKRFRAGVLDAFLLRFMTEAEGRTPFLDWVRQEYDEAALRRDFQAHGFAGLVNGGILRRV